MPPFSITRFIFGRCSPRKLLIFTAVCCLAFSLGLTVHIFRHGNNNEQGDLTRHTPLTGSSDEKEQEIVRRTELNALENVTKPTVLARDTSSMGSSDGKERRTEMSPLENATERTVARRATDMNVDGELTGKLNLHTWDICGFNVEDLRQWPSFPRFPDKTEFVSNFTTDGNAMQIGERIFGFVHPKVTGIYRFAITSDDTSELWLSTNEDPKKVRLISSVQTTNGVAWTKPGDYNKYPKQISGDIFLEAGKKYFIEALHKQGRGLSHVFVLWKPPRANKFGIITGQFLTPFYDSNEKKDPYLVNLVAEPLDIASHYKKKPPSPVTDETLQYYYNTPVFGQEGLENVLPNIMHDRKMNGVRDIKEFLLQNHSFIYPEDTVKIKSVCPKDAKRQCQPNEVLPKADAERIVNQFMSALEERHNK